MKEFESRISKDKELLSALRNTVASLTALHDGFQAFKESEQARACSDLCGSILLRAYQLRISKDGTTKPAPQVAEEMRTLAGLIREANDDALASVKETKQLHENLFIKHSQMPNVREELSELLKGIVRDETELKTILDEAATFANEGCSSNDKVIAHHQANLESLFQAQATMFELSAINAHGIARILLDDVESELLLDVKERFESYLRVSRILPGLIGLGLKNVIPDAGTISAIGLALQYLNEAVVKSKIDKKRKASEELSELKATVLLPFLNIPLATCLVGGMFISDIAWGQAFDKLARKDGSPGMA